MKPPFSSRRMNKTEEDRLENAVINKIPGASHIMEVNLLLARKFRAVNEKNHILPFTL